MTKDDYLHIFRTFWPSEGYAGIVKHLPEWSHSRASNFAYRNGIKMTDTGKTRIRQALCENARNTKKEKHFVPVRLADTPENRFLTARW
jgi:hypothetical protein